MLRHLLFRKPRRNPGQMELEIRRQREPDRNFDRGGRSFYFFDFDDNVAFLSTPIFIFHKKTGRELSLSSGEFAEHSARIGKLGTYEDFQVNFDDEENGSFRCFRDADFGLLERVLGRKQAFVQDLTAALGHPEFQWKGPSWSCFYHAVFNQRPVSVITARGHHPDTIREGIRVFKDLGHLPHEPNYLSLFPVSHKETQLKLGFYERASVAEMKQAAIRASVLQAFDIYGYSPHHRFGMSDDDPKNIELITEEMTRLKKEFSEISFFVIKTCKGDFVKREIFVDYTLEELLEPTQQMSLFDN